MQAEIIIPQPEAELLLVEAALREVSAEEILTEAFKKYMERNGDIGGR